MLSAIYRPRTLLLTRRAPIPPPRRPYTAPPRPQPSPPETPSMSPAEESIAERLRRVLHPTELLVRDVSGGCGSMYAIDIASPAFRGASILKQQRMVNAALGDVMRGWHGLQLNTRVSE
ncbi:hypothetical protein E4U42_006821 [Claviceps africana]|uniref:Altered inheritance of mitochondria protein 1 n=1 Tax=Claviceps africana TaxID=83212 RepID=A0A8K0NFI0_9HYPO|nr:hypothetical protein E4U42_006821 [Claviceps africana]